MNTVFHKKQHQKSLIRMHGLTLNLKRALCLVEVVINHVMSAVTVALHCNQWTKVYVIHHKNQRNGRNVVKLSVHQNGQRANGKNVVHLVAKMVHKHDRLFVSEFLTMGKLMLKIIFIKTI